MLRGPIDFVSLLNLPKDEVPNQLDGLFKVSDNYYLQWIVFNLKKKIGFFNTRQSENKKGEIGLSEEIVFYERILSNSRCFEKRLFKEQIYLVRRIYSIFIV